VVKQTLFVTLNALVAFGIGFGLWYGVFRTSENPIVHSIYQGGPLVVLLIMILIMLFEPLGLFGVWIRTKKYWRTWPF